MPIAKLNYEKRKDPLWMIILSIVAGSVLMVYPVSYETAGWRPSFMLMILLFWILYQPVWCGVWFAFGMGIFVDLLLDAPLGLNALSFVLITFATRYFIRERRILTFGNSWVIASDAYHFFMDVSDHNRYAFFSSSTLATVDYGCFSLADPLLLFT